MEQEYNWKAILWGAVPMSVVMIFVFFSDISRGMKWFFLVIGMAAASAITYYLNKKKQNIFTSMFLVLFVALVTHGLKNLGFF